MSGPTPGQPSFSTSFQPPDRALLQRDTSVLLLPDHRPPGLIPYDIEYSSDGKSWEVIAEEVRRSFLELDPERTARKKGFYRARTR